MATSICVQREGREVKEIGRATNASAYRDSTCSAASTPECVGQDQQGGRRGLRGNAATATAPSRPVDSEPRHLARRSPLRDGRRPPPACYGDQRRRRQHRICGGAYPHLWRGTRPRARRGSESESEFEWRDGSGTLEIRNGTRWPLPAFEPRDDDGRRTCPDRQ